MRLHRRRAFPAAGGVPTNRRLELHPQAERDGTRVDARNAGQLFVVGLQRNAGAAGQTDDALAHEKIRRDAGRVRRKRGRRSGPHVDRNERQAGARIDRRGQPYRAAGGEDVDAAVAARAVGIVEVQRSAERDDRLRTEIVVEAEGGLRRPAGVTPAVGERKLRGSFDGNRRRRRRARRDGDERRDAGGTCGSGEDERRLTKWHRVRYRRRYARACRDGVR